jgi:hypothetical protein
MKIRIMGLPAEVARTIEILRQAPALDVIEISNPYPNRQSRVGRDDTCPDCGVRPGDQHTAHCGAKDNGQQTWPGFGTGLAPGGIGRMVRVYIEAQLHPDCRAVP